VPLAREQRKLAAIVAADVVGYSRLMGRDESGTLARLRKNRSERLDPILTKYGGRLVKFTGDGALVEFPSAVDALSAAIEFQQAMAEANGDAPLDAALVFRKGLHLGDLIVDGDDLYGDGVNVAARLEAEAPAGGIVISRTVQEAVTGRLKATFDDLGGLALKNIERPVQAFSVKWEPSDWQLPVTSEVTNATATAMQKPLPLPDKPSIPVLPFQNMSGDPEQEYSGLNCPEVELLQESTTPTLRSNGPLTVTAFGVPALERSLSGQGLTVKSKTPALSEREVQILDGLVKGHANKVIARRCGITEATVKVHMKSILRKIRACNRTQAAIWALEHGYAGDEHTAAGLKTNETTEETNIASSLSPTATELSPLALVGKA